MPWIESCLWFILNNMAAVPVVSFQFLWILKQTIPACLVTVVAIAAEARRGKLGYFDPTENITNKGLSRELLARPIFLLTPHVATSKSILILSIRSDS